jgi:hypothetical protein
MTTISYLRRRKNYALKRYVAIVSTGLLLALVGCGGGGGGAAPLATQESPPPESPQTPATATFDCNSNAPVKGLELDVSPDGVFTGTFVDCATGVHTPVSAMVSEDGTFNIVSLGSPFEETVIVNLLTGSLQTDGDSFQGSGRWFTAPGVSASFWLDGVIEERTSIEGRWGNEWGGYGFFNLYYDDSVDVQALEFLINRYRGNP